MNDRSLTHYKLMILYMLKNIPIPLTNSQISEFFVTKEYSTYFELQQSISELEEAEFIRGEIMRNTTSYYITPSGESAIDAFEGSLLDSIKSDILESFYEQRQELRRQSDITADYYPTKKGDYVAKLSIRERGTVLLEMGINVASKEQAISVCDHWNEKCESVYKTIVEQLLL